MKKVLNILRNRRNFMQSEVQFISPLSNTLIFGINERGVLYDTRHAPNYGSVFPIKNFISIVASVLIGNESTSELFIQ